MKPILFAPNATDFTTYGIGVLADAIECNVIEERNGAFELTLNYPITGAFYSEIKRRSIILAKPSVLQNPQPFRVYEISRPMNGNVTIYAAHLSYDLKYSVAMPFRAGSCALALQWLQSYAGGPWTFWTDKNVSSEMSNKVPNTIRSLLGGIEGSVLDLYGGEYKWDGYTVRLYVNRGLDRGVQIRYGKNMTDISQDENCADVYTEVLCYYYKEAQDATQDEIFIYDIAKVRDVYPERRYDYKNTLILDVTGDFDDTVPIKQDLFLRGCKYITDNNVGVPKVSLSVSFEMLGQTEDYKGHNLLENVELCDEVTVIFEKLGVNAKSKVIKTDYNTLLERYNSIELGEARSTLSNTIVSQEKEIEDAASEMPKYINDRFFELSRYIDRSTALITGNVGGYVVLRDTNGDRKPDEILIMDNEDFNSAINVWRWNKNGLGHSSSGYSGPYTTAITYDGQIVADMIKTGELDGNLVRAGSIGVGQLSSSYMQSVMDDISRVEMGAEEALEAYKNTISQYMTFDSSSGLVISNNAGFSVQITSIEMGFYDNGTKVAYINNEKLFIDQGEVKTSFKIGNYEFRPRPVTINGVTERNLSLVYVGGD